MQTPSERLSIFHPMHRTHSTVVLAQQSVLPPSCIADEHRDVKGNMVQKKKNMGCFAMTVLQWLDCNMWRYESSYSPWVSSIKDVTKRNLWQKAGGGQPLSANGRFRALEERWQQDNSSLTDAESPPLWFFVDSKNQTCQYPVQIKWQLVFCFPLLVANTQFGCGELSLCSMKLITKQKEYAPRCMISNILFRS